jgi:hypothetical protein
LFITLWFILRKSPSLSLMVRIDPHARTRGNGGMNATLSRKA